jgi:hypothetical protein
MDFRHWLYLAVAALSLLGSVALASGVYVTWRDRLKVNHTTALAGQLERRGSVPLGALRDDDFERQLNWLREHKRLVKTIEGIAIAVLALIAFVIGINQP